MSVKLRVLVVDDNAFYSKLVERVLVKLGCEVSTAPRARDGLALAESARPDLILLDTALPDMSGYDALGALKADPATARIPVLLCSSFGRGARVRALGRGAADLIRKTVQPEQLRPLLARALNSCAGAR